MSRCILDDEEREIEVVIGWDAAHVGTFFARVCDHRVCRAARKAGREDYEEAGVIFWTGGFDRIHETPDELIERIQPYACHHDKEVLRRELLKDQCENRDRREYSVQGAEVEEY
jgi:hypothetical protein